MENSPDSEPREDIPGGDEAVPVCECCLAPYSEDYALFCPDCGAPVDSLAMYLPYESILAEGFFLRRAVERPVRPITVIGIWLLVFSPGGGMLASQIGSYLSGPTTMIGWTEIYASLISMVVVVSYWVIGFRCTAAYFRYRSTESGNAEGPSGEGPSQ